MSPNVEQSSFGKTFAIRPQFFGSGSGTFKNPTTGQFSLVAELSEPGSSGGGGAKALWLWESNPNGTGNDLVGSWRRLMEIDSTSGVGRFSTVILAPDTTRTPANDGFTHTLLRGFVKMGFASLQQPLHRLRCRGDTAPMRYPLSSGLSQKSARLRAGVLWCGSKARGGGDAVASSTTSNAGDARNPPAPFGLRRREAVYGVAAPRRWLGIACVAAPCIRPHGAAT